MATRVGVDIGGTFTDLIFYDDQSGDVIVEKVPTTPLSPEGGCIEAVNKSLSPEQLARTAFFLHGTTVGINSLLERKGATVGLLATRGFRDVLEIRRGDRAEMYNLIWTPPPPIVPRHLRLAVEGRMLANGSVHVPLKEHDVLDALDHFTREGVNSIAIAFINAYANPEHELECEGILRRAGFDGAVSLSHRVSGEYREYERTTTTVVDAFVRPRMQSYLSNLDSELRSSGFKGRSLITRSGSGSMSFEEAQQRPFETIMSGPVAGAEGAGELARNLGLNDLIAADVGGTSFDTCLIIDGRPQLLYQGSVLGLPLQTPWVDVRSIGAGGGSIARVDAGGLLRVGPESAGSQPGPVCYGRGGEKPTLTDAALYLGMLGKGELASGVRLDRDRAEEALKALTQKIDYELDELARGIVRIAATSMSEAMREISIEQGLDPRQMSLLAFGGAGPLMATLLADELEMSTIIVPPYAGNFSAWGLLGADLLRSTARTHIMPLNGENLPLVNSILDELFAMLGERGSGLVEDREEIKEVALDVRYRGQEHTLTVKPDVDSGRINANAEALFAQFVSAYEDTFGGTLDTTAEIVSVRAAIRRPLPRRRGGAAVAPTAATDEPVSTRAYSFSRKRWLDVNLWRRADLPLGETIPGPAIVTEQTTTTYVDSNYNFTGGLDGCLRLQRQE